MEQLKWLDRYSGQTTAQLIALEGNYRTDSIIVAFEQAITQKAEKLGYEKLTDQEQIILAVEALEREVNNGGYLQFFTNPSRKYVPVIVNALKCIGCNETAELTQEAIDALEIEHPVTAESVENAMDQQNSQRDEKLSRCDDKYYKTAGDLAEPLLNFIKNNKQNITLPRNGQRRIKKILIIFAIIAVLYALTWAYLSA